MPHPTHPSPHLLIASVHSHSLPILRSNPNSIISLLLSFPSPFSISLAHSKDQRSFISTTNSNLSNVKCSLRSESK